MRRVWGHVGIPTTVSLAEWLVQNVLFVVGIFSGFDPVTESYDKEDFINPWYASEICLFYMIPFG